MPQKLVRCFLQTKQNLRADHDDWSKQRVERVARAICVKSTGQKFTRHDNTIDSMFNVSFGESGEIKGLEFQFKSKVNFIEKHDLEKFRPAVEINDPDSILSVGTAIFATDSKNFNRYAEKELKRASETLRGKSCQIDHNESALSTFGVVQDAWWDGSAEPAEVAYIAELEGSNEVAQKVKKKYIHSVSVSGMAEEIICSICDEEWSWAHEHFPGEVYDGETCFRDMKKITFRHLGFTNFPGIEGADTQYVANSVDEAIENAFAYVDYMGKHGLRKQDNIHEHIQQSAEDGIAAASAFGENISMGADPEKIVEKLKLLETSEYERARLQEEKAKLEVKLAAMEEAKPKSDADIEALKEAEKKRLINEIVDLQEKLELTKGRTAEERRVDLAQEPMIGVKAKAEALREIWDKEEKKSPPQRSVISEGITGAQSRSRTFKGSKFDELDPDKKKFYEREAKLEKYALGLFGHRPSVGAVQTLSEWNDELDRWNTDFADMFKTVPKLENVRR